MTWRYACLHYTTTASQAKQAEAAEEAKKDNLYLMMMRIYD